MDRGEVGMGDPCGRATAGRVDAEPVPDEWPAATGVAEGLARLSREDADLAGLVDAALASPLHDGVLDMVFMGVLARQVHRSWSELDPGSRATLWAEVERCCRAPDADGAGSVAHLWLVGFVEAFWNRMLAEGRDADEVMDVLPPGAREYVRHWISITGG